MSYKDQIDKSRMPKHVAIIMDGNGRWAKRQGKERIYGHQHGVDSVDSVLEGAVEAGLEYLTLYAFSTENWNRPQPEVDALMDLFVDTIHGYLPKMLKNNVRLLVIGDKARLSERTRSNMQAAIAETAHCSGTTLVLAISYSARWEIVNMVKELATEAANGKTNPADISEQMVEAHLCTNGIPDPDLLIRTSGELRISNFLLWQLAYSELYFTEVCWPDFKKEQLFEAIVDYQGRERRFGKTSEQIEPTKNSLS
jgi:undecaprenyl diphosphate synthase